MRLKNLLYKRWLQCALILLLGYGVYFVGRAWDRRADGFTLEKIHSTLAFDPSWDVPTNPEMIEQANAIVKQPFHYLGKGFQCYAFVSDDDKYVLKFVRHQRLRPPKLYALLPDLPFIKQFKERRAQEREKRKNYLFKGLKVGFEDVPEETGLLFIHLNKTENQHPTVIIFDRCETKYEVALDDVEFILQKKATLIKPTLTGLMKAGKVDEAKQRIDQIFALLVDCAKKGVVDTDGALIHKDNLGFLPDRAIYIDSGKLTRRSQSKIKARFESDLRRLRPLYKWLLMHYPALANHFEKRQKEAIESFC